MSSVSEAEASQRRVCLWSGFGSVLDYMDFHAEGNVVFVHYIRLKKITTQSAEETLLVGINGLGKPMV